MNIEELRNFCLSQKGVEETFPFGPDTLVFKVMGKVFCLSGLERMPFQCNLKCEPEKAIELREEYSGVLPGWHMNKTHWNTLEFDGSFGDEMAKEWILGSYNLVASGLTQKLKHELEELS
jgi:predicted DNA-binding protein (MmcQ/YjbR family)